MKPTQVVFLEITQQWDGVFKDKLSFKDLEELLVCEGSFCIFLISVCRHHKWADSDWSIYKKKMSFWLEMEPAFTKWSWCLINKTLK